MKITLAMLAMMKSLDRTGSTITHLSGRSAHGGAVRTRAALHRHGLIDGEGLTAAGYQALMSHGIAVKRLAAQEKDNDQ